jgi:hypothetical protein
MTELTADSNHADKMQLLVARLERIANKAGSGAEVGVYYTSVTFHAQPCELTGADKAVLRGLAEDIPGLKLDEVESTDLLDHYWFTKDPSAAGEVHPGTQQ